MQPVPAKIDWLSIGQLGLGALSCLICFLLAAGLVLLGASGYLSNSNFSLDALTVFMLAGFLSAMGLLHIPSVFLSLQSLRGKPFISPIKTNPYQLSSLAVISLPIWLIIGQNLAQTSLAKTLLPLVSLPALVLPIWWLVEIGRRQLPSGSPQRSWGLVSAGLGLVPLLVILVELAASLVVIILIFSFLSNDPAWMQKFSQLLVQFNQSDFDPQFLASLLKDLASNPLVITTVFLTLGLLMPLLEEILKPLALWFLRKRMLHPAEGFSAGLLAGAGFALVESAGIIAQTGGGADWGKVVVLRIATSLLHITASGFVGWGLVRSWTRKKHGQAFLALMASACVHGLWNSLAIATALLPIIGSPDGRSPLYQFFASTSVYSFVVILGFIAAALILMNRHLRREMSSESPASKPEIPV
jgi:hypothetical protein